MTGKWNRACLSVRAAELLLFQPQVQLLLKLSTHNFLRIYWKWGFTPNGPREYTNTSGRKTCRRLAVEITILRSANSDFRHLLMWRTSRNRKIIATQQKEMHGIKPHKRNTYAPCLTSSCNFCTAMHINGLYYCECWRLFPSLIARTTLWEAVIPLIKV